MDALAELLQPVRLGHWLIIAGGLFIVLGALGLIGRTRRVSSEVEDEVTSDAK
ncbi:hypothetical protein GGD63_006543 [Bradyrhizobium sp. cir1]|uniref:hypothetical protein n=1 Tax=Bradyrhizobium sp. cir1 TaxID=1445730 RepID=UPI001605852E|nr:hypothetical protein [Bradyrhizobium sp. cir1]MBB4373715.1 hypothetical protein [Bradyrhizobium sp. cir1]